MKNEDKINEIYLESLRRIGAQRRMQITSELSELSRAIARAGLKYRNPELSEEEIERKLKQIINNRGKYNE